MKALPLTWVWRKRRAVDNKTVKFNVKEGKQLDMKYYLCPYPTSG